ncbi:uncharacterized protein LOC111022935 [Momordica charantia]|uniref:Uncharacterized protein LOC111022935 n=1 Tax=Momordica charantia TaxID=3673 RepID=A0A6J1DNX0_MOMCH|nr:uncharacterized protein LOC111022935 [Momordica charantia]
MPPQRNNNCRTAVVDEPQDNIPVVPQNQKTNRNAPANDRVNRVVEQFRMLHPPSFDVACATYMLKIGVNKWWNMTRKTWNIAENPMGSDRFKELFYGKFFPLTARQNKEADFIKLEQGKLSLIEYEKKFEELSHYAPHLVDTDWRKARKFERGLRPELRKHVAAFILITCAEVLQKAQILSQDLDNMKSLSKDGGSKRKFHRGQSSVTLIRE